MSTENDPPAAPADDAPIATSEDISMASTATPAAQGLPVKDLVMTDVPLEQAHSPVPAAATTANAPSPIPPARTGTPSRAPNGQDSSSRAASQHPDPGFTMPTEVPPHGDSVRKYLNTKVTGVLLEGMKQIAKEQPKDPLRALGEYLLQRSKELEGTGVGS